MTLVEHQATTTNTNGHDSSLEKSEYPSIQPGGSLMIAWQVRDKPVLLVGGGSVAASRAYHLLNADALVTVVAPANGLEPELAYRIMKHQDRIRHVARKFDMRDLDRTDIPDDYILQDESSNTSLEGKTQWSMVLVAIDDPNLSSEIASEARKRRIPVNIADVPSECDFYFGAVHRDGPVQVMVSSNGNGPRMAAMLRDTIRQGTGIPPGAGRAVTNIGRIRQALRRRSPAVVHQRTAIRKENRAHIRRRMRYMSLVSEGWSLSELSRIDQSMIDALANDFYRQSRVLDQETSQQEENTSENQPSDDSDLIVPMFEDLRVGTDSQQEQNDPSSSVAMES